MKTTPFTFHQLAPATNYNRQVLLQRLSADAYIIMYSALWNGKRFHPEETKDAILLISAFIEKDNRLEKNYEEFVQRILAEKYMRVNITNTPRPAPTVWLRSTGEKGFAATEKWFSLLHEKRQNNNFYRAHWRDFAWAVWYSTPGAFQHFHRWRSYFAGISQSTLNLYLACMANRHMADTATVTTGLISLTN